jgi:hypothetical protein
MLTKLRQFLFLNALRQALAAQTRKRKTFTVETAGTIGILFDASKEKTRRDVLDYAKQLEKKGKKVRLFGFFDDKQIHEGTGFEHFTLKETNWRGIPKSEKAAAFAKEKFDLLLSFNSGEVPALEWLAVGSQAAMKIGPATERPNDFDVQLETPEAKGIPYFTEQLHHYLNKIIAAHEPAKTL